jgi:ribonuclease R
LQGREDWRDMPLSPSIRRTPRITTTRFMPKPDDDPDNKGGFIVNVAIADVAFYVRPDRRSTARRLKRGNSVYFPDRVVPMLPERISNDLCSLKPGEPRGALALRMVIDARRAQALAHISPRADALGCKAAATRRRRPPSTAALMT